MNDSKLFEAEARSLSYLTQLHILEIPFFQRPYVWEEENWEKLYKSFFENETPDFLGSIILKHNIDSDAISTMIIDGQQRLTTLSLFAKALFDNLNDLDKKLLRPYLERILYRYLDELDENGETVVVPKLKHSYLDSESFVAVMNNFNNSELPNKKDDRIIECYKYFIKNIKSEDYEKVKKVINVLLKSDVKIFVGIVVHGGVDEQKVFDTLNNAGVRLTITDTIKNYLFNKATKVISNGVYNKTIIDLYNENWDNTFNIRKEVNTETGTTIVTDIRKKWEQEVNYGRITRNISDLFLQAYATIKGFYKPEDTIDNLAKKYKEYIDKLNTPEEIIDLIRDIKKYADTYYNYFIKETDNNYSYDNENIIKRLLLIVRTIDFETLNPYILHILVNYKDNKETQNKYLHMIEKMVLITYLGHNTSRSKNYNKLCVDFINNNDRLEEELKMIEAPSTECIAGLYKINENVAKMLLFLIEIYRRKSKYQDIKEIEFLDSYQLEHIMPKKWQVYWNWFPEKNYLGMEIEESDLVLEKERYIKSLGNMTLLNGALNNHIKNRQIKVKINGDDSTGQKGIKDYVDLKITKDDIVDYYYNLINQNPEQPLEDSKIWNEEHIKDRNVTLLKELIDGYMY